MATFSAPFSIFSLNIMYINFGCSLIELPEEEPIGEAPEFTVCVQNCSVKEGKVASFSCRVIGEPTPELTWQLNGEPLTIEGRYTVVERDGLQLLQVHNVVLSDAGEYTVTAKNNHGGATSSANMTVEGRIYSFDAHSIILLSAVLEEENNTV